MKDVCVLLLEDNDAHAEMVSLALEQLDDPPEIRRFERGEDMVAWIDLNDQQATGGQPNFALIDQRLPGMSGTDVLARIRQSPRLNNLPVAILTSSHEPEDRRIAEQLDVQGYYLKPIHLQAIVDFANQHGARSTH